MNSSSSHISVETLVDLAEGRQPAEADLGHVSSCSICNAALMQLSEVIRLMRSDQSEVAPRDVLNAAMSIFVPVDRPGLRRLIATLTFDSFNATPAFGFRSSLPTSRQLIYSAPETDLDLRVTIENEKFVVAGQVLRNKCAPGQVEISGATGSAKTELNDMCEFTLAPVERGRYSLSVRLDDVEVEVPELN